MPQEITVTKFVFDNQAVITVIGVFVALTEFATKGIDIPIFAHYLSFLCLTMVLILSTSLALHFKWQESAGLFLFQSIFLTIILFFALFWFEQNLDILYTLRYDFIFFIILLAVVTLILQVFFKRKHKL